MSGEMLFATAWRTQMRAAARSLISAVERVAEETVPESVRSACWRALVDGIGRFALAQTATKFIAGFAIMKDPQLVVSTNRTRKFGQGRHSRKQEGANASAKIQERSGPLLVNEWNHRHDPKLEHGASELFCRRDWRGKK